MTKLAAYIHIPKTAGKAVHHVLSGSLNFLNLGHRAAYQVNILCKDKFSEYSTDQVFPPDPKTVGNNGYIIKTHMNNPERFNNPQWPISHFDWAYNTGFSEEAVDFHKIVKPNTRELDTSRLFASIRNPFTQLISYWKCGFPSGWLGCNIIHNIRNFEHFIDLYCDDAITWHWPEFKTNPFCQIYSKENELMVPKENLIRFENLKEEISRVADILGLDPLRWDEIDNWKDIHRGSMQDIDTRYTPSMVSKLRKKLDPILNEFDYDY